MSQFKMMSLAEAAQGAYVMTKLQELKNQQAKSRNIRDIARQSTDDVHSEYELSDNEKFDNETLPGLKKKTGTKFNAGKYQKNLSEAGYLEEASKVAESISKMDEADRDRVIHTNKEVGKLMNFVKNLPEGQKQQGWQMALMRGKEMGLSLDGVPQEYDPKYLDMRIKQATNIDSATKAFTFGNIELPDGTIHAAKLNSQAGAIEYKTGDGWKEAPEGTQFTSKSGQSVKFSGAPTKLERNDIDNMIDDRWPQDMAHLDDESSKEFVVAVAARARYLQKNEGIDWDEAKERAFDEKLAMVKKGVVRDWWFDDPSTFKGKKLDPDTNMRGKTDIANYTKDNPAKITSQKDFDDLSVGDWFINPKDGKPMVKKVSKK